MDGKTFSILFLRYRRDFIRFSNWLTRDRDEADDLVQELYCHGRNRAEKIPENAIGFIRWMLIGIRYIWRKRLRSKTLERKYTRRACVPAEISWNMNRPDTDENMRPYRFLVFDAVRQLPKMYRAPITLYEMMDIPCAEVARIEHTVAGTIKSRLYRSRKILRMHLAHKICEGDFNSARREAAAPKDKPLAAPKVLVRTLPRGTAHRLHVVLRTIPQNARLRDRNAAQ